MPDTPIAKRLIDDIVAKLQSVTPAGGYHLHFAAKPQFIDTIPKSWESVSDPIYIYVVPDRAVPDEYVGSKVRNEISFLIKIIVRPGQFSAVALPGFPLGEARDNCYKVVADVCHALMSDIRRSDLATDTKIDAIDYDFDWSGEDSLITYMAEISGHCTVHHSNIVW